MYPALPITLTDEQQAAAAMWGVGPIMEASYPGSGAVNEVVLLRTSSGAYVLRGYRHQDRLPVAREHAIIDHVRARGAPAVPPLPLPDGSTILERRGRFYALFPRAAGSQVTKSDLGVADAMVMGRCLAQLHDALRSLPPEWARRRSFEIDRGSTLARIDHLEAVIRARTEADPVHAAALTRLAAQRAWVHQLPAAAAVDFGRLEQQVIHGDYQETNLFFTGGAVSAVIDWDQTYVAPRAFEVLRTLHLSFEFAPALCQAFLAAYRDVLPLPRKDVDLAAAAYDVKVRHDLWLLEAFYLEGNTRVGRFLLRPVDDPVAARWAGLRSKG